MDNQMELQQKTFRQEAFELLGELENALLSLEESPDNEDLIGRVFRAMHTIKGSGAMFGFKAVSEFTHELETVFDLVRSGKISVTRELIGLSLEARDLISEMMDASDMEVAVDPQKTERIITDLKGFIPESSKAKTDTVHPRDPGLNPPGPRRGPMVTYRVRFRPSRDLFAYGTNPMLLIDEIEGLGECHVVAHTDEIPSLSDFVPDACYVFWDILLTTDRGLDAIWDVFIFVADTCQVSVKAIDEAEYEESAPEYKKLGEILVDRGDLAPGDVAQILKSQKLIGELLTEAGVVSRDAVDSALEEQAHVLKIKQKRITDAKASSVRVDAHKLDRLVDLVGELVTVQARLSSRAASDKDGELTQIAEEVERLVEDLRDNTMSIRMLPIGATFSKFKRLVRDLSGSLGKEVLLTTEGGETELDKTVLEQLNDPLVHIIRNCIDHGIELPEVRKDAGKPLQGTVHLSAAHIGGNVIIRIRDDGAGLDLAAIRESAVEKGLIAPEADLSDREVTELIFMPGFSTTRAVTEVSGRGVGMDVVKKSIETLRGTLNITSERGVGTTITLELPLTLAIIEGFMVTLGEERYVLPLSAVEECVEIPGAEMETVRRRNMLNIRGNVLSYLSLREVFGVEGARSPAERIVVIKSGSDRIGFGVDGVVGQHQTVIKSLGSMYRDVRGISGATILGDGSVALILDVVQLIEGTRTDLNGKELQS